MREAGSSETSAGRMNRMSEVTEMSAVTLKETNGGKVLEVRLRTMPRPLHQQLTPSRSPLKVPAASAATPGEGLSPLSLEPSPCFFSPAARNTSARGLD